MELSETRKITFQLNRNVNAKIIIGTILRVISLKFKLQVYFPTIFSKPLLTKNFPAKKIQ